MKKNRICALLLALAMMMGLPVLPAAAETEPAALLPGDVMDDEMEYTGIDDVAWGTDWITQNIAAPDGFTGTWPDAGSEQGKVEMNNGKIKLTRVSGAAAADAAVKRTLSDSPQPKNDMTVEFEYVKEAEAKIYMAMESPTGGGPFALVQNADGSFTAAGQGSGGGLSNLKAVGTVKITMHLHKISDTEGNMDVYVNDQLLKKGFGYDPRYTKDINAGKIRFVLQKNAPSTQGITINYIRYMETSQYANIAMAKDAASVDVTGLPEDGASITENITLPQLPAKLPYGSTGVWESSDDSILNAQTGEVTRGENDQNVTLSLKLSKFNEAGEMAQETTPTLSFTYTVTGTAADSGTPGTKPVSLPGDVMDDAMGYADINAVPWGYWRNGGVGDGSQGKPLPYLFMYSTGGVVQPDGFTGTTWYDDETKVTKSGSIAVENGNLKLTRTAAKDTGDTISLNKFLTIGKQPVDKMTLEFEYVREAGVKMQIGIQATNNWRGALALTQNANGTFAASGQGGNTVDGSIASTGTTKITMHLDRSAKSADIYVNDQLLKENYMYDPRYDGYYDAGKLGFTILKDSEKDKSVTFRYIRYMEMSEYANIALAKDKKANIDVSTFPADGATLENDVALPALAQLPYGSIPFLESSDDTILNAETGEITKRLEEQNVTLSLKLKKLNAAGEYTVLDQPIQQWNYKVAKSDAAIDDDVNNLTVADLLGQNAAADKVTTNLVLPNTGKYAGSEITWSVDPEDAPIDLETGAVTRPVYGDDVPVTLKATFAAGGETRTKDFNVTILTVPSYGENLALHKPTNASSFLNDTYAPSKATDGDRTNTRWATGAMRQWITIDLGTPTQVSAMRTYEFGTRLRDFVVEYSDDGTNWNVAATVTGLESNTSNSNHRTYTVDFAPVTGRYFRLRETANAAANITIFEVELYDTTQRLYESAVSVNDEALGGVQRTGGPGYALGEEVAFSAQPSITGKFVKWQLPEGLVLTEGTETTPEIKYAQPQKNIKIVAEFAEKAGASIDVQSAIYDKYDESENHQDVAVTLTPGDYVFQAVYCGKDALAEGTHYTKEGNVVTLLKSWMETLSGEQTVVFQMDGGNQPSLKLTIVDNDPATLIKEDLAALKKPEYQLKDGMAIPAVGPLHGSDITVASSNSSAVQIVRETQNGQLVNKIVVTAKQSTNLNLTVTGTLNKKSVSLPAFRCAVAGKGGSSGGGSGSGGSGGGGGGGSVSRPSSSGVVNYGTGTVGTVTPPQPSGQPGTQPGRFQDMDQASWAKEYVELLAEQGVVSGDPQGNFQPEREVTREEYVKMIVLALGLEPLQTAALPFEDVSADDWSYPYIAAAYQAGIISGTGENTFGAGTTMSRQDIAVVTSRALDAAQVKMLPVTENVQFTDKEAAAEYAAEAIERIARGGIVGGYPDGSFRPQETITRAEAAKVLAQIIRLKEE